MKLTVLGGSAAGSNPGQGCSGYLVESGETRVVLDLGTGTFPELRRHADFRLLDAVVLSHCHLDHMPDILALRYALAYNPVPAESPLALWVPPGGIEFLKRLARAFIGNDDIHEFLSVFALRQYDPDAVLTIGELELRFFSTVHYVPCWAMRVSNGVDADLFCKADTGPSAGPAVPAAGSHVVIAEGTQFIVSHEPYESRGHMSAAEAGALARDVGAKTLVLTHLWLEDDPLRAASEASRVFGGPVELATPGLDIPWHGS